MEGWKIGRLEDWKDGRTKAGRLEDWKIGREDLEDEKTGKRENGKTRRIEEDNGRREEERRAKSVSAWSGEGR